MAIQVQYQFTNSTNWESFWSDTYTATQVPGGQERFYPIPRIDLGLTANYSHLAFYCTNQEAPLNWKYGGRYLLRISTGLTVNLGTPETTFKVGKVWLNQIELVEVPPIASEYGISIEVPFWHRSFDLKIWGYTGSNVNSRDAKLDQLLLNTAP